MKSYKWFLSEHLKKKRWLLGILTRQKRRDEFNEHNIERLTEKYQMLERKIAALEKDDAREK